MKRFSLQFVLFMMFLLCSCSGTRHLPEGDSLYVGTRRIKIKKIGGNVDWHITKNSQKLTDIYIATWDLPNGSFGLPQFRLIPTRLFFYNWFYTDNTKGFSYWMMNNFGEPPVTLSTVNPELKVKKVVNIFENYGHFGTTGSYNEHFRKKKKLASVYYHFNVTRPYRYRSVQHVADSTTSDITTNILQYKNESRLREGDEFSLNTIREEKLALWNYLQNSGYYFIKQDDVEVLADTTVGDRQIDVRVELVPGLPASAYQKQVVSQRTMEIDSVLQSDSGKYYQWPTGRIKRRVFDSLIHVNPGSPYSITRLKQSMRDLSETHVFSNTHIAFKAADADSVKLDSHITVQSADATSIGFNVQGNYINTGYIGPSVGLNFTQLNLYGGAENLSIDFDAFYNFPIGVYKERVSNSSGFSLRSTISAPMLRSPFKHLQREFGFPRKNLTVNAELTDRKDYFKLASWNAGYAVTWKTSERVSHRFTVVDATYSDLVNSTPLFDSLVSDNPSLLNSLSDQFLLGSSYSYKYDNSSIINKRLGTYFEARVELSGNLLWLVDKIVDPDKPVGERLFGADYSQFAHISYDFRAYLRLANGGSSLNFRHVGGIGLPYGNSRQMPYIRQFFIGGSNSLRPFSARTIGPGRYIELSQNEINQVGDMKLEWNLEYRFDIWPHLSGAIWSDYGNIWLLDPDPNRPYGEIRWRKIFHDSYLTAGLGLRLKFNLLIARVDYGAVLYAPLFINGYKWLWQNKLPLWGPVIGIGLPF